MELRQLSHFVAVAEEASFTRGARRAHIAQSAASATVARLERELGVHLFERGGRDIVLTREGQLLLERARRLLADAQSAIDDVHHLGEQVRGVVRVGHVLSTGDFDLAGALAAFRQQHPMVSVQLQMAAHSAENGAVQLLESRVHLLLTPASAIRHEAIQFTVVGHLKQVLICRSDHPLAAIRGVHCRDLGAYDFVDFPAGWGNRQITDELLEAAGARKRVAVEVVDVASALRMVRKGIGIAFVPEEVMAADVVAESDLVLVDLVASPAALELALAIAVDRTPSGATRALRSSLLAWGASPTTVPRSSTSRGPHHGSVAVTARIDRP